MSETPETKQPTPKRRWRPRFSLLTLVLGVLFVGACGGLWWRWEPWVVERTLSGWTSPVWSAALSPDGGRIITAAKQEPACVRDINTGSQLAAFRRTGTINFASFSRDGTRVVTASEPESEPLSKFEACVWDVASGREVVVLEGHDNWIRTVTFSPDGKHVLTACSDGTARLWDAQTGAQVAKLSQQNEDGMDYAEFSPDGRSVIAMGMDKVFVCDDRLTVRATIPAQMVAVFSPDGRWIAMASPDGDLKMLDAISCVEKTVLGRQLEMVCDVRFSPDGRRVVAGGAGGTARIWDVEAEGVWVALPGHTDTIFNAVFSPDGTRVVTTTRDEILRIWDSVSGRLLLTLRGSCWFVAFCSSGERMVTAGLENGVHIWSHRRPEWWWGIAWLPEFWIALLSGAALAVIAARRLRARKAVKQEAA